MNVVGLIKICSKETHREVHIGKHLSIVFPVQNVLKQGDALPLLVFNCALEYSIGKL
jgi:hypothetical protein